MAKRQFVNLENLGFGVAKKRFQAELEKVIENILDVNMDPAAPRKISLDIVMKPPKEGQGPLEVKISCSSTLAKRKEFITHFYVGKKEGQLVASEFDPQQGYLFDEEKPETGENEKLDTKTGEIHQLR